jgi:hypothetical protein
LLAIKGDLEPESWFEELYQKYLGLPLEKGQEQTQEVAGIPENEGMIPSDDWFTRADWHKLRK